MEPQLILRRIETHSQSSSNIVSPLSHPQTVESKSFTGSAKWDVNHPFHLAVIERAGILQTYTLETTGEGSKAYLYPCGSFQLHLDFEPSDFYRESEGSHDIKFNSYKKEDGISSLCLGYDRKQTQAKPRAKPIDQAWGSFEFIPGRLREIIFFQDGSSRILFARLPGGSPRSPQIGERSMARIGSIKSRVYCVGRHSSTILSIAVRGDGVALVSAARDGYIRIWRITDGSMLAQTMFSRWRQPRSPMQGNSTKSKVSRYDSEVAMEKMSSSMQVLSFLGNSGDLYMGCPNGEVRIWSMTECESSRLTIAEVGNGTVGKDVISSLALHVPNCNFPVRCNDGDDRTCSLKSLASETQEFLAIGTVNQNLQVWTKQTTHNEWIPLWSSTLSIEGTSIVSLSFRADGGLLAVAASRSGKPIAVNDHPSNPSESSSRNQKQPCDRLYLYNTSSWACEGWLSFTSHLGSCLFYHPHFTVEDKSEPRSSATQVKVSSCRLLLVSTSSGPQTHILPEFGFIHHQREQHETTELNCGNDAKNVDWAHLTRKLRSHCQGSLKETHGLPEVEGEGDGSGSYKTSPMPMESEIEMETDTRYSRLNFNSDETSPKSSKNGTMAELSREQIGLQTLRRVLSQDSLQDRKSLHPSPLHKIKTKHPRKTYVKEKESNLRILEASLVRGGHAIKKHRFKKQLPIDFVRRACQNCKKKLSSLRSQKQQNIASSSNCLLSVNPSPTASCPYRGENNFKERTFIYSNIAKVGESYSRTMTGVRTLNEHKVDTQTTPALPCHNEERVLNRKVKKEVTFIKTPEIIPSHIRVKIPRSSEAAISHSRRKGEKGRLGVAKNMKSWGSRKENPKHCDQQKLPKQHKIGKEQRHDLGGAHSRHRIGGGVLQELLIMNEESSPFKDKVQMGGTFRVMPPLSKSLVKSVTYASKPSEDKPGAHLNRPVPFSTANLMQRLQDIEHEKFDLDAAFQVAKAKGIVLSKHDREEIKAALDEERKQLGSSKCQLDLEGRKPSARYIPLLKIPDPRISHSGPFVAPRKVKKQLDIRGEDMHTIQPALLDLWDLQERCPQVSSANLEQANTFSVTSWRRAVGSLNEPNKNSVWVQREDVCRAATTAQAVYHSCLYGPNLEPACHCYEGEQEISSIHFK